MEKILLTYGDDKFKKSLLRLKKEAKSLKIFDKINVFTPYDLPLYIKSSPLYSFDRLGGYAIWKPYLINKVYNESKIGDIIVYVDGGCELHESEEWEQLFDYLETNNNIVFQYRSDFDYNWKQSFGEHAIVRSGNWIKRSLKEYFSKIFPNDDWLNENKIWSGAFLTKKSSEKNILISEWLNITLYKPELIMDVFGNEINEQELTFVENRHDQAVLGILAFYYRESQKVLFIPETSESKHDHAAIVASRIKDLKKVPVQAQLKKEIRRLVGIKIWSLIKIIAGKL